MHQKSLVTPNLLVRSTIDVFGTAYYMV